MPCYDARDNERVIYQEDTTKVDKLTRMLCGIMNQLTDRGFEVDYEDVRGLKTWWRNHQAADRRRVTRETALAKLTAAEREVLGL